MNINYIAIDFETTGLSADDSKIIEIGAVKFTESGEALDCFEMLADPGVPIPVGATKIHGITDTMVSGCFSPLDVWNKFLEWAGDNFTLFAHNAQFEASFIKKLCDGEGELPDVWVVDTLKASRKRLKNKSSYKLVDLIPSFDGNCHRALPDAKACVALFTQISETYKSGKLPLKTYATPLSEFKTYEEPTGRQISYIRSLGGYVDSVKTKQQASIYIDNLKSNKNPQTVLSANLDNKSSSNTFTVVAIAVVLLIIGFFVANT